MQVKYKYEWFLEGQIKLYQNLPYTSIAIRQYSILKHSQCSLATSQIQLPFIADTNNKVLWVN